MWHPVPAGPAGLGWAGLGECRVLLLLSSFLHPAKL